MSTWRTRQRLRRIRGTMAYLFVCLLITLCAILAVECAMIGRATAHTQSGIVQGLAANAAEREGFQGGDSNGGGVAGGGASGGSSTVGSSGSSGLSGLSGSTGEVAETEFPSVDWGHWKNANPDILGWVSIPGTAVSYPIAVPPVLDPTYYLDHDVHGRFNRYGCIYLDDECREDGLLGGKNTVILGHHMSNGTMFAPLADYVDESFANAHRTILLQTPQRKVVLQVVAVDVVPGDEATKRTTFVNDADFERWWRSTVSDTPAPSHVWTFCTCSYFFQDDERTLVYAVEASAL